MSAVISASIQISIHALRKESDLVGNLIRAGHSISIHALRKESDAVDDDSGGFDDISIHALRKESDFQCAHTVEHRPDFNPRSP